MFSNNYINKTENGKEVANKELLNSLVDWCFGGEGLFNFTEPKVWKVSGQNDEEYAKKDIIVLVI